MISVQIYYLGTAKHYWSSAHKVYPHEITHTVIFTRILVIGQTFDFRKNELSDPTHIKI